MRDKLVQIPTGILLSWGLGLYLVHIITAELPVHFVLFLTLTFMQQSISLSRVVLKSMGLLYPEPHGWAFISDLGEEVWFLSRGALHFASVSTLLSIYRFSAIPHMLLYADQPANTCLDLLGLSTQSSQLRQALGSLSRREETAAGFTALSSCCFPSLRTPCPLLLGVRCFCVFVSGRYLLQLSLQLKMSLNLWQCLCLILFQRCEPLYLLACFSLSLKCFMINISVKCACLSKDRHRFTFSTLKFLQSF